MKRTLILLATLLLAIPISLGIMASLAYYSASAKHIPKPIVKIMNQNVAISGYTWRTPVFGGLVYRDFKMPLPERIADIGEVKAKHFEVESPDGYETNATLSLMGQTVWAGRADDLAEFEFLDSGRYRILLECLRPAQAERGYGSIFYQAAFSVVAAPRYQSSEDWVTQGDVMAIRIYNLPSSLAAHAESEIATLYFTSNPLGQQTAYVPIGHSQEAGSYVVFAGAARANWEIPLRVTDGDFDAENILLEKGQTYPLNASDAPEGFKDYQENIVPLFAQQDNVQHWDGVFINPIAGKISAEYGLARYVNGADVPMRHSGIDIEAEKGNEVLAANSGRVVFSAMLESTGNTVVIEHGGGLKSYYYHLDGVFVNQNQMLTQGQALGTVGASGQCQSPHLHYEVRLGAAAINPTLLSNGTSRLYYFN